MENFWDWIECQEKNFFLKLEQHSSDETENYWFVLEAMEEVVALKQ